MKRISDSEEAIMLIPVALKPVEVELALVVPLVEIRNVPIAIAVLPLRTNVQDIIRATTP